MGYAWRMSKGRGLLPEWRYWPALPLGALFALAIFGAIYQPKAEEQYQASQHSQADIDPRSPEERTADYNLWLERFTGLLFASGMVSLWLLWRTDRTAQLAANTAAAQTVILDSQTEILRLQKDIARQEYLTTHRPRIVVRALKPHLEAAAIGGKYPVEFIILNEGESDANITEIGTNVFCGPGPWTYGARKVRFDVEKIPIVLVGGQPETRVTKAIFPWKEDDPIPSKDRGVYWFCVGYIKYRGTGDTFDRATGFCRIWDFKTMTWERWPSEEHEYAY